MAFPRKIDRGSVVAAALAIVEREGHDALTLRRLASDVGVTANALYRYFENRDVLVAAAADAVAHRLTLAIEEGVANSPSDAYADVRAPERVRRLLTAYAAFAERHPALYQLLLGARPEAGARLPEPRYHERLWAQSLSLIEPLVGADDAPAATVGLWSLLHGSWALRRTGLLGGEKPADVHEYAFDVVIRGLQAHGKTSRD